MLDEWKSYVDSWICKERLLYINVSWKSVQTGKYHKPESSFKIARAYVHNHPRSKYMGGLQQIHVTCQLTGQVYTIGSTEPYNTHK